MGMKKFGAGISVKNNVEAVEFYKKVFGLELKSYDLFPEGNPYYGEYMHAELWKGDEHIFDVQSLAYDKYDFDEEKQIINFGVYFENEAEVLDAFTLLSEGGVVVEPLGSLPWSTYCATVIDKYGILWWISV